MSDGKTHFVGDGCPGGHCIPLPQFPVESQAVKNIVAEHEAEFIEECERRAGASREEMLEAIRDEHPRIIGWLRAILGGKP